MNSLKTESLATSMLKLAENVSDEDVAIIYSNIVNHIQEHAKGGYTRITVTIKDNRIFVKSVREKLFRNLCDDGFRVSIVDAFRHEDDNSIRVVYVFDIRWGPFEEKYCCVIV